MTRDTLYEEQCIRCGEKVGELWTSQFSRPHWDLFICEPCAGDELAHREAGLDPPPPEEWPIDPFGRLTPERSPAEHKQLELERFFRERQERARRREKNAY